MADPVIISMNSTHNNDHLVTQCVWPSLIPLIPSGHPTSGHWMSVFEGRYVAPKDPRPGVMLSFFFSFASDTEAIFVVLSRGVGRAMEMRVGGKANLGRSSV